MWEEHLDLARGLKAPASDMLALISADLRTQSLGTCGCL